MMLFGIAINAQIEVNPGVRAGLNLSSFTNTDEGKSLADFYLGGFAEIDFSQVYKLQPELNYSRQGSSSDSGNDVKIQYLSFTVANKIFPSKNNGFHFVAGPSLAFKVGDDGFGALSEELESIDLLFFGGIGYEFPMGLGVEARYNLGLIDIFGSNVGETVEIDDIILNKFFQIGVTYEFDLGR